VNHTPSSSHFSTPPPGLPFTPRTYFTSSTLPLCPTTSVLPPPPFWLNPSLGQQHIGNYVPPPPHQFSVPQFGGAPAFPRGMQPPPR
jgi:hypothetical protein